MQTAYNEPKRNVARVFFTPEDNQHLQIQGLDLDNHMQNVAALADTWDAALAFGASSAPASLVETHHWLVAAAERHDEGKPRRFALRKEQEHYTYSFSGHRFEVIDDRPYVQWLIRLHHSFSVADVTEAQAALQQETARRMSHSETEGLLRYIHCFPLDLYALEMCDQIESAAACFAFGQPGARRNFMEFELLERPHEEGQMLLGLFPYPFRLPEIHLTFTSFVVVAPYEAQRDGLTLKRYLLQDGPIVRREQREVRLCPVL